MPEFKKKTALGLRDLPENGQECTHVLLTHSEYDGLLAKVACAERDARSVYTAASQKIAQAERNSAQAKEAAYAEVNSIVTLYFTFPFIGEESMKKITVNILRQQTAVFPVL